MNSSLNTILDSLPGIKNKAQELKEILLANLAMIGKIPAPTFKAEDPPHYEAAFH